MDTATRKGGGLSPAMRKAMGEAIAMRRDGAPREVGLAYLHSAGFNEALADMIMDHCDASVAKAEAASADAGYKASASDEKPNRLRDVFGRR